MASTVGQMVAAVAPLELGPVLFEIGVSPLEVVLEQVEEPVLAPSGANGVGISTVGGVSTLGGGATTVARSDL